MQIEFGVGLVGRFCVREREQPGFAIREGKLIRIEQRLIRPVRRNRPLEGLKSLKPFITHAVADIRQHTSQCGEETHHTSKALRDVEGKRLGAYRSATRSAPTSREVNTESKYKRVGVALMRRFILVLAVIVFFACLTPSHFPAQPVTAATPTTNAAQITAGPELEMANENMAILRWTVTIPGGTDLHYGIVRYGTDAMNLTQVENPPIAAILPMRR
jgi:hypothetical protein